MRTDILAGFLGLVCGAAPSGSFANELHINTVFPPSVAPVTSGPACPNGMVLRDMHLDTLIAYARYDAVYAVLPKKNVRIRRLVQSGYDNSAKAQAPQIERALDRAASNPRPVELHLRMNMRLCHGGNTVKLVNGDLSVNGQIGHYKVHYDTTLTDDPEDNIHLYWRHKPFGRPVANALGQLFVKLKNQPLEAQHPDTGVNKAGTLDLLFNVQFASD